MKPVLRASCMAAVALAAALSTACAALHPPPRAEVTLREQAPVSVAGTTTGNEWPGSQWWKGYGDATLDQLVDAAIGKGPEIAGADARIRAAEEEVRAAGAALGLNVDASFGFTRQRLSDNGMIPPSFLGYHWYDQSDIGIAARYQFDWWGKQRAAMEGAISQARARGAERQAATLALAAAVSETYFGWQADSARIALQEQVIALQERQLGIAEARIAAQLESADSALEARRALAAQREMLEALRGSRQLRVVTLAGLLGVAPEALPRLEAHPLPRATTTLPDDVGTNLMARRPDIQASRWRVEAALRDTDAQRARFYPDVSLHALAALSSIDIDRLLRSDSRAPQVGLAIDLPIFDAGLRRARYGASRAALSGAVAAYDQAVVNAAREAGAAATSLQQANLQRAQREQQLAASQALGEAAAARLRNELTHAGPALAARLAELSQQDQLVQVDLAALLADVQLKQALGGDLAPREANP